MEKHLSSIQKKLLGIGILIASCFLFFAPLNASSVGVFKATYVQQTDFSCERNICTTHPIGFGVLQNAVAFEMEDTRGMQVRFFDNERWLGWTDIIGEDDTPDFETHHFESQLFILKRARAFQLKTQSIPSASIRAVSFTTPSSPYSLKKDTYRIALNEEPNTLAVVTRANWLDTRLELVQEDRERLWKTEYDSVKKIIIHHTATSVEDVNKDGVINTNDYRDSIRAIYNYHTRSRKWGDIGYNYIIDPAGGIWEGRYGGDGAVAGHSFREKACTKFGVNNTAFNKGTIGIALLGTYSSDAVTPAAAESLSSLIARKSWDFGFEPAGSGFFVDKTYPNILAHRDVDCTDCPGDVAYASLSGIVARAQEKYSRLSAATPKEYRAAFVDTQPGDIELKTGEEKEIVVRFRNMGSSIWRNYGDGSLQLASSDIKESLAAIDSFRIASDESRKQPEQYIIPSKLLTPNVMPGDIGSFSLSVKDAPPTLISYKKFVMVVGNHGWIPHSEFSVKVINTGLEYAATLIKDTIPSEISDEEGVPVKLQFLNRGTTLWKRGDIQLALSDINGEQSALHDRSWKKKSGDFIFKEKAVKPGEIATFLFRVNSKALGDVWTLPILRHKREGVSGSDYEPLIMTVKPTYAAEILSIDIPKNIDSKKSGKASVTVKNIGTKPWPRAGLVFTDQKGKNSAIRHTSWLSGTLVDQAIKVKPEESVLFLFDIQAPAKAGAYMGKLRLEYQKTPLYLKKDGEYSKELAYSVAVNKIDLPLKKIVKKKK
ncbi:MAG: peptidoglycan recognition family protein [bacterium]|nr:peptidoglycan recognition family protein [bacterium]